VAQVSVRTGSFNYTAGARPRFPAQPGRASHRHQRDHRTWRRPRVDLRLSALHAQASTQDSDRSPFRTIRPTPLTNQFDGDSSSRENHPSCTLRSSRGTAHRESGSSPDRERRFPSPSRRFRLGTRTGCETRVHRHLPRPRCGSPEPLPSPPPSCGAPIGDNVWSVAERQRHSKDARTEPAHLRGQGRTHSSNGFVTFGGRIHSRYVS
jgi:hypothetical protein